MDDNTYVFDIYYYNRKWFTKKKNVNIIIYFIKKKK